MTGAATEPARRTIRFAHMSLGATVSPGLLATQAPIDREWAWGTATGRGVRVCVVDSGVDTTHPMIGAGVQSRAAVTRDTANGPEWHIEDDTVGDVAGHGTACAGVIRQFAPDCDLVSVRVLGNRLNGNGDALLCALEWAVRERFQLVNVSLSTRHERFKERLHDLADEAYFGGVTLVSAAHNSPVNSYPWRFPSVISVGSHAVARSDYLEFNPTPPVDFFAPGVNIPVAWPGGTKHVSGNSFATPHVVGMCARILELHPQFRTAQLRHVLSAVADNIR